MNRKLLLPLALVSFGGVAHAGDKPLYAPAPDWVKPALPIDATHLTDDDPVMLMFDQQERLQGGEVSTYADMAIRISSPELLTRSGTLPIPWDPSKGDLTIHRVEILRGAEHIDVLAAGAKFNVLQREQQLEQATLNGLLTATLPVEGLRVGDVLHVSFSISQKDPALHGHVQSSLPLMADPMRVKFGRVRLLWPKSVPLRWTSYAKKVGVTPIEQPGGYLELTVPLPIAKLVDVPGDAPLRYRQLPVLDAADYRDWADLSKDMAPLFATDGAIKSGSPLQAEVDRIAAASSDPKVRTAMALQLVQDKVRYLFRGMDDGGYVPQQPAQTWSLRYGDCKAKALLLVALLRGLGIQAEPVLVSLDMGDYVANRLPMPGAFNHMIATATIDGATYWLDGTGSGSRLSDLGDVPPFRHALPLRPGGAPLVDMPLKRNARPTTVAELEVDATAGVLFPMPYSARVTVRGQTAAMLRVLSGVGKDQQDTVVDGIISKLVGNNETVERKVTYDDATGAAVITASGLAYSNWAKEDGRYRLQLDSTVSNVSFAPDRSSPIWSDIPATSGGADDSRVRTRIHLPGGGTGFALEGDQTLPPTLGAVMLDRTVALENGWITVDDRVTTGLVEVAPADIPAARAKVAQAQARLLKAAAPADYQPAYRQIAAARQSKAFAPILAVYAKQIAAKPDEASSYTDRAWFLDSIYDRQGAIADLTKALTLKADVDTYLWRARLYSALKDDAHALSDVKAAMAIDPSSQAAIGQLATIEARTGKRDEAVAMLAEHVAQGGKEKNSYATSQAELMGDGGKVDEAVAMLDGLIATSPGSPDLLNSRCWLKGTHGVGLDTALKDCTKAIELSDNSAAALDSRAMVYFRMNRMDDALADLNAALDIAPEQAGSLYLRGVIRKHTGDAQADADLSAARLMSPRIDEDYQRWGIKP